MKPTTYWIYFIAGDETINSQRVTALSLRDAIIKASARQLESGKDCNFFKAEKEENPFGSKTVCFDYGTDDPSTLTY